MPIIGAHVSTAGGVSNAIGNAQKINAECIQIFGASPRSYFASIPAKSTCDEFKKRRRQAKISPIFLHAPYLINLASADKISRQKSVKCLISHLRIGDALGADGVIFHIGSAKTNSREEAKKFVVACLKEILSEPKIKSALIIENAAGGGGKIGVTLEEIGEFFQAIKNPRLQFCLDTAHSFESGLISEYTPDVLKKTAAKIKKYIGEKNFVAIHANDSMTAGGSNHDRHENIGEGYIGIKGFAALSQTDLFKNKPWILEVPGFDGNGPDRKNINILQNIIHKKQMAEKTKKQNTRTKQSPITKNQ